MQDDQDELDGPLDGETDDSIDELLQHWDHRPDQTAVPSWKAVLKNTEICNRCGKKVDFALIFKISFKGTKCLYSSCFLLQLPV